MSVYTKISTQQAKQILEQYSLGDLVSLQGITEGVTNTIYLLTTDKQSLLLTVFEELDTKQLKPYLELTEFLSQREIPCPTVFANQSGQQIDQLADKPFTVANYLPGSTITQPSEEQLKQVATTLAKLHLAGKDYPHRIDNQRGALWREQLFPKLAKHLSHEEKQLLEDELSFQQTIDWSSLPQGIIHADLFRDNVLFDGQHLTGLIDFYYACTDAWLIDIAITINDWCLTESGLVDSSRLQLFIGQYQQLRPLLDTEKSLLNSALRLAALRFYLSRLADYFTVQKTEQIQVKDPNAFAMLLKQHRTAD